MRVVVIVFFLLVHCVLQIFVVVHLMVIELGSRVVLRLTALDVLVDELFDHGNHLLAVGVAWHHVSAELSHDLAVSHFLVVIGVNLVQKLLNLLLLLEHAHRDNKRSELTLVKNTILVQIKSLEVLIEFEQKALVLLQLEVQDYFLEVLVHVLLKVLVTVHDLLVDLLSGQLARVLLILLSRFLVSVLNNSLDLLLKRLRVLILIHLIEDLHPDPFLDLSLLGLFQIGQCFCFRLQRVLVPVNHPDQSKQSVLYMVLDQAEFLVTLVLEDLGKQSHLVVFT